MLKSMKYPLFSGPPRKPHSLYLIRRVTGNSMLPALKDGKIIIVRTGIRRYKRGDVVVITHENHEKIKRITNMKNDKIYVEGDNMPQSTDSRYFGWLGINDVIGKVIWPWRI